MRGFTKARVAIAMAASMLTLGAALLLLPTASCCDCAGIYNMFRAGSQHGRVVISSLSVGGDGCGSAVCAESAGGGGCFQFMVPLKQAGTCHLTATASDGRQATADVTVQYTKTTCCGKQYSVGANDVDLSFAAPDGGTD
jgi:hypothetical protein